MKPFHFTLESVATLRRRQEQRAMEKYAQSLLARHQAMENLEQVGRDLSACWEMLRGQMSGGCTAAKAVQTRVYESSLMQRRDECARALENAERRMNAELHVMLQARQQREIVDKFFDNQKAGYEHEQARAEQKNLDEMAGRRSKSIFAWKQAENSL
jgi:flagellar export protein FliJ